MCFVVQCSLGIVIDFSGNAGLTPLSFFFFFLRTAVKHGNVSPLKSPKRVFNSEYLWFYFGVWNMSCETDPESVMKDDWLHLLLFCVLYFLSPVQSPHFPSCLSKQALLFLLLYDREWRQRFLFLPSLWQFERSRENLTFWFNSLLLSAENFQI